MLKFSHSSSSSQAQRLLGLTRALNRASQYQDRIFSGEHDLSPAQGHVLGELWQAGDLSMGELATRLRITRSTATRIIDLLEKKEFVRRRMAKDDRRQQRVRLTPRGEVMYETLQGEALHIQRGILGQVTATEREFLLTALSKLLDAHEKYIDRTMPLEGS